MFLFQRAPNLTGIKTRDAELSFELCKQAIKNCEILGNKDHCYFVTKYFENETLSDIYHILKTKFVTVDRFKPQSSRKISNEIYLIAKKLKKPNNFDFQTFIHSKTFDLLTQNDTTTNNSQTNENKHKNVSSHISSNFYNLQNLR